MWILQTSEAEDPLMFQLPAGAVKTIGRAPRADFVIDAALVSRLHCRVVGGNETVDVEDLSSTNGTFVNGNRVATARLSAGDRLKVGRIELTVARV
jgi:pSer/pThr/pTyr-binding forkhead associated (FHA) protein